MFNNNNNTNNGGRARVQREPAGKPCLLAKVGTLPYEVINTIGSFVTDSWVPLDEAESEWDTHRHVRYQAESAVYPEERLDQVAELSDDMHLYGEGYGVNGLALETDRAVSHHEFAIWANVEPALAAEFFGAAQAHTSYRTLVDDFALPTDLAILRATDAWYFHSDYVILPAASHILRSRPDPVLAVLHTTPRARARLVETIRSHQWMILALKAMIFLNLPMVEAGLVDRYDPIFHELADFIYYNTKTTVNRLNRVSWAVQEWITSTWTEYSMHPVTVVQLYLEIAFLVFLAYFLHRLISYVTKPKKFELASVEQPAPAARFIKHELTPLGWVYEFSVNGEVYHCVDDSKPRVANDAQSMQDEMALPGSSTYPSKKQPVGGIYVVMAGAELTLVGCFWRLGDLLVTALHVANAIHQGTAKVYLGGVTVDTKGKTRAHMLDMVPLDEDFFDDDENCCRVELDVFARALTSRQWARLPGITKASAARKSQYEQVVSAVGYHGDLLVTAAGKTLKGSGPVYLWHTASTQKGFSGSPIFNGKSVVGMHISAHDVPGQQKNVAIRYEAIAYYCSVATEPDTAGLEAYDYTSDAPTIEQDEYGFKFKGRRATIERFDGDLIYLAENGQAWYGYEEEEIRRNHPGYAEREAEEDEMDRQLTRTKPRYSVRYDDEGAILPDVLPAEVTVHGVVEGDKRPKLYCQASAVEQPEVAAYLDSKTEELSKLNYQPEKYLYPEVNSVTERISCEKHLNKFVERTKTITVPPSDLEKRKTVAMVLALMAHNKYEPDPAYKTKEGLVALLDSSLVKPNKSPGRPYLSEKLATNAAVLEQYTTAGFAEMVLNRWNEKGFDLRVFLKSEPTKREKLDAGMARVITGMPLHKMVQHQAIFKDLIQTGVENWGKSPIVGGFSPVVGGHIQNLALRFKGRKVYGSDKPCWDYMYHQYLFEILEEVLVELPIRTSDWTDEGWEAYLQDIRDAVREVSTDANYVCSDGTTFKTTMGGAMKSGWVLTFFANSVGQLIVDSLIKVRLGWSVDQVTQPENAIMVGGDDVLQTFPDGFDTKQYIAIAAKLGLELTEFEVRDSFNGSEFFSHVFHAKDGAWTYEPTRFTKHVAKLRRTKLSDLPDALVNHMRNHVWMNGNFGFFRAMYMAFRKDHPDLFEKHKLKSQNELRNLVRGLEASW